MTPYKIVDADAHMLEIPKLLAERLDRQFRDRAPRIVKDLNGQKGEFFVVDKQSVRVSGAFATGVVFDEKYKESVGIEDALPGGYDPAARLKDMELDGVECAALYPTFSFTFFWLDDAKFHEACFRAYNDWLADFVSYAPNRFAGLALIPLHDPAEGVRELERCKKLGLKGGVIWAVPPEEQPYNLPIYDRVWAAAQDLEMPLSLHLATGRRESMPKEDWLWVSRATGRTLDVQDTLLKLIFSGVLERFPRLKIVSAENDLGWVPFLMERADKYYRRWSKGYKVGLSLKPSEYFARQVYATFIDDPMGLKTYQLFPAGATNFLWSTDYPHQAATWPHSQETMERDFQMVPEADRRMIVRENAVKLYGFPVQ